MSTALTASELADFIKTAIVIFDENDQKIEALIEEQENILEEIKELKVLMQEEPEGDPFRQILWRKRITPQVQRYPVQRRNTKLKRVEFRITPGQETELAFLVERSSINLSNTMRVILHEAYRLAKREDQALRK